MTVHLRDGTEIKGVARIHPILLGIGTPMLQLFDDKNRRIIPFPELKNVLSITRELFGAEENAS